MKKITIIYSPQCPWNIEFIEKIKNWATGIQTEIEEINLFQSYKYAKRFLDTTSLGYNRHTFIAVFINGRLVPRHPGSIDFKQRFLEVLNSNGNNDSTA